MSYLSDIEIAHRCKMQPISEIAEAAGIDEKYVDFGCVSFLLFF